MCVIGLPSGRGPMYRRFARRGAALQHDFDKVRRAPGLGVLPGVAARDAVTPCFQLIDGFIRIKVVATRRVRTSKQGVTASLLAGGSAGRRSTRAIPTSLHNLDTIARFGRVADPTVRARSPGGS